MILLLSQFSFGMYLMAMLLTMASIFMILLILVQQGRGGGLTGALGGMGGQSAFGTKAGDLFTRITIITAVIWILLSILTIAFFNPPPPAASTPPPTSMNAELDDLGTGEPAENTETPSDPPKAEDDKGFDDNTKLNPPTDAVPQEPKPADDGKDGGTKENAPSAADPSAVPPGTPVPAPDADKSGTEPTGDSDKPATEQTPSSSDGGKQQL